MNIANPVKSITMQRLAGILLCLAAVSCTSVPTQLEGTYSEISPARVDPAVFGSLVRWGGVIIDAKNEPNETCFEILSRELDKYLRPKVEDRTAGRFIACREGFHDPEVFAKGREVTLTARIDGVETHKIDDFDYRYPVLTVNSLVLWEEREDIIIYRDYYDPFWYPYYWGRPSFGYYPYYRGPYTRSGYAYTRPSLPGPARVEPQEK